MKCSNKIVILTVVLAVIAVLIAILLFSQLGSTRRTLTKIYTTHPLNLQEAKSACPIELPDSAHNIQFFKYGNFMAIMRLVKFEAPVEQCILHAKGILPEVKELIPIIEDKHLKHLEDFSSEDKDEYIKQKYTGPFSVEWFDPYNIKDGLEGGCSGSHSPQVWIDVKRGIFYYRYTD